MVRGKDWGNCKVIVQRHYLEAMSEASTAIEETEPLGQCYPRRSLGKSISVERGQDACCNKRMYTTRSGFLQVNFFRIFVSPCEIGVCGEK
jgi:hypothetical protein